MKAKALFLSTIILGSFSAGIINSTSVQADNISDSALQNKGQSFIVDPSIKDTDKPVKLGDKIDLDSLDINTRIIMPAYRKNDNKDLGTSVTANLTKSDIQSLKDGKPISMRFSSISTKSDWGGDLEFRAKARDKNKNTIQIVFDETTQKLMVKEDDTLVDKVNFIVSGGASKIHYVEKDTNKEVATHINKIGFIHADFGHMETGYLDTEKIRPGYFDERPYCDFEDWHLDIVAPAVRYDPDDINESNTEFTVYLYPAKPFTVKVNNYLDNKLYNSKTTEYQVHDKYEFVDDPQRPDEKTSELQTDKTSISLTSEYAKNPPDNGEEWDNERYRPFKETGETIYDYFVNNRKSFSESVITELVDDNDYNYIRPIYSGSVAELNLYYKSKNKPSGNNNAGNNNNNNNNGNTVLDSEDFSGLVGTMKKTVNLYKLSNNKMELTDKRKLAKHTDWKTDRVIRIGNVKYYRVSTNEWVKSTEVYRYEVENGVVNTRDVKITDLVESDKNAVTHRGLANNTSWVYDRVGYLGNSEEKHYRVSTNEFVHEKNVDKNK